ncbi:23S rRNA (adenine(1618)-N(6))-methyltransferase RlmF [Halpernia frigidisoli]|uniref:Ribosomal RNA large subunit methyltransferase F n=1 Tax=Halpernia frigidisoli TaxID=1125876 RepID=A0A1I3CTF4_9FLAO|nr:23S rRNA (adenine(1618)-N(6))-methyltransferase RlmF [Halpernia frigidisoli]SFH77521.1 23S rRNA m(6)A-1618 methyltransferase [Halpernia frigidisoli]
MSAEKNLQEKTRLHARNKNRERYDLKALTEAVPELKDHLKPNKNGEDSIDFANPSAVKLLNKALLNYYYGIKNWDFPDENLVPPIPGRADYLHYMADLITQSNFGSLPKGEKITGLDIGVGASCIYPIIGVTEYDWNFIGSDINAESVESSKKIIDSNEQLKDKIEIRLQKDPKSFFEGILNKEEKVDFTMCNPPFHTSSEEAEKSSRRKVQNLSGKKVETADLNFAGINNELIYEGGEHTFIHDMIAESKNFEKNCYWFSTLVSKESNLKGIYRALSQVENTQVKTIAMGTGNKVSRIVAWSFLSKAEQKEWKEARWTDSE